MNVASLELCKELFELSGWDNTEKNHYTPPKVDGRDFVPAYTLGYLLRKLPPQTFILKSRNHYRARSGGSPVGYWNYSERADTPEDATCKLTIELFKQGILK